MTIIDSQVQLYEANTPKRPWHSVPNWPDRQLCDGSATGPSRPVRARQAGQPERSGGGRCHRRLKEDAGHGRRPHQHMTS